jgi:hypothetical protein
MVLERIKTNAYIILIYLELQGKSCFKNILLFYIFKNKADIDVHAKLFSLKNHETFLRNKNVFYYHR